MIIKGGATRMMEEIPRWDSMCVDCQEVVEETVAHRLGRRLKANLERRRQLIHGWVSAGRRGKRRVFLWQKKARAQRKKARQRERDLEMMGLDPGEMNLVADTAQVGEQEWVSISGFPKQRPGDDLREGGDDVVAPWEEP